MPLGRFIFSFCNDTEKANSCLEKGLLILTIQSKRSAQNVTVQWRGHSRVSAIPSMFPFPADCGLVFPWETLHTLSQCLRGVSSPPFPKHTNNTAPIHYLGTEWAWTASSEGTWGLLKQWGIPCLSRGPRTLKQNASTQGHLVSKNRVRSGKVAPGEDSSYEPGPSKRCTISLLYIPSRDWRPHAGMSSLDVCVQLQTQTLQAFKTVVSFSSQVSLSFCHFQGNSIKAKQSENFCQYLSVCTFTVTNWRISTAIWFVRNALLICAFA